MVSSTSLDFHGMVGRSAAMRTLFQRIERVAPVDVPVLVVGESGTGKELAARAIQRVGPRHGQRFETVNCGALTRELLLSELFGHERGAFTGAVERKAGLLAVANGGTVFLDEIGELPLEAQAMLLRFLENGEIRPVGSTQTIRADIRLISATNRDLESAIEQRAFREDLYYRLFDVVLEVPPLRERREDIPLLAEHFRARFNRQYGLSIDPLRPETLRMLETAPWRGNVRELQKVLKHAMIFRCEGELQADDLRLARHPLGTGWMRTALVPGGRPASARLPLSSRREAALRIARDCGAVTRRDLARECGISGEVARQELLALARLGCLRRVGRGRSTVYVLR
jgi:transcriptional regulator with GAF, ATPase, and Fis domain